MTSNSPEKHAEVKERKYDLNSFASASMKVGMDQSDEEDDLPLSVRKTQNNVQKISNHQLPSTSEHPKSVNAKAPSVTVKVPTSSSSVSVKAEIPSPIKNDVVTVKQTPSSSNGHHNNLDTNKVKNEKNHLNNNDADANSNNIHSDNKIKHASPKQIPMKREAHHSDDEDDVSLAERAKKAKQTKTGNETKSSKKRKQETDDDYEEEEEEEYKPPKKKSKSTEKDKKLPPSSSKDGKIKIITTKTLTTTPTKKGGRKVKEEETVEVWKWWEEEKHEGGIKWKTLEHKGPLFAPPYIRMPENINFYYDGKPMKLSQDAEEVATFYAKMLKHDYTSMEAFNKNFFKDWRKVMTAKEKEKITDLKKCDFKEMCEYFEKVSEERRNRSKEEKQKEKEERDQIQKEFGIAIIDNHKEKIGNFRIEPPGLFRGRGTHPKMGMLKKRIQPEDVIINCSKGSKIPTPPAGHKWKEVRHDNTVTWLASWSENIMGSIKYVMLNPASKIKGEKDWAKYEVARKLKTKVGKIRETYREDWKSKEMRVRQRAVALYFIDKLALRAGNEKEEGETADTVGCCSLRCEHMKLHEKLDGEENVVEFDFLGKDSIRYYNKVSVEKRVFKNLKLFMEGKNPGDDVFDRLNTMILNKHLQSLMDGLTAKVFRTYNASFTLRQQLELLTKKEMSPSEKLLAYNRANRQVAILCNHQRAVPKAHSKQMDLLQEKIKENKDKVKQAKKDAKDAKRKYKDHKTDNNKKIYEQKKKTAARLEEQLQKLELRATDKEENKEIALGTSKLNYLDPRISVAWCKKWDVPIEKVYNKTQREKFRWAIDMAGPDFLW